MQDEAFPHSERTFEQRTYCVIDYKELDKLVREIYNRPKYRCLESEEWFNDSEYAFYIKKGEMDDFNRSELEEFESGENVNGIVYTLLLDLCNRGIIPEGNYLITVCF